MYAASPIVKPGKTMWNVIVKANWRRASIVASTSIWKVLCDLKRAGIMPIRSARRGTGDFATESIALCNPWVWQRKPDHAILAACNEGVAIICEGQHS